MEARVWRSFILLAALSSLGAGYRTTNFVVNAPDAQLAEEIGRAAEKFRRELSLEWLGHELPRWSEPCPITVQVGNMGAGGVTQFNFARDGRVFGWQMAVQGSRKRVLDSVLPHEVTHTIFATHFKQPLPRWADEGACTTVEHAEERARQQQMLVHFLQNGKGISFTKMFAMMQYPRDMLPLYAQGYSLARFFIEQGGRRKFVEYVEEGLANNQWETATAKHYGHQDMFQLQDAWLAWVRQGSPQRAPSTAIASAGNSSESPATAGVRLDPRPIYRGQSGESKTATALAGPLVAVGKTVGRNSVAGPSGNHVAAARGTEDGWRAIGAANNSKDTGGKGIGTRVAADVTAPRNQVARPPNVERSRQVILQWNRQSSAATTAAAPAKQPRRRSIYDTSRSARGILRR